MVDDLNERYANGKPSDDYGEIGFVLRIIDGVCRNPTLLAMDGGTCDHNLANVPTSRFFEGTVDVPNNLPSASYNMIINAPKSMEFGEGIAIFQSWSEGYGPAAGLLWFPCAVEKHTRCMWPSDGTSDGRPLTCGRWVMETANRDFYFPIDGCVECLSENNTLSAEENTVDGRTIHRLDDVSPEANISSYEIELLFNRARKNTVDNTFEAVGNITRFNELSTNCEKCKSNIFAALEEYNSNSTTMSESEIKDLSDFAFYWNFIFNEYRWFEGQGFYGTFSPSEGDNVSVTKPRNELKQMLETQLEYFGPNHNYSEMNFFDSFSDSVPTNEWSIDAMGIKELEVDRMIYSTESSATQEDDPKALDFEGKDADGNCGAAIKALVLICGEQDDPFYYGKRGQCLDFAEVYKTNFDTEDTPPVVYLDPKNLTHPFSTTCDIEMSCGVEGKDTAEEKDTSTVNTSSIASVMPMLFSGYGLVVSFLAGIFIVII